MIRTMTHLKIMRKDDGKNLLSDKGLMFSLRIMFSVEKYHPPKIRPCRIMTIFIHHVNNNHPPFEDGNTHAPFCDDDDMP